MEKKLKGEQELRRREREENKKQEEEQRKDAMIEQSIPIQVDES